MRNSEQYPFTPADSTLGEASLRPYLPITLTYQGQSVTVSGLLDTGSMVEEKTACFRNLFTLSAAGRMEGWKDGGREFIPMRAGVHLPLFHSLG